MAFTPSLRSRIALMAGLLLGATAAAWFWAFAAFHSHPVLLGTAILAYTLGLRHAVDADHIAAIDNVTRKLVQQGKRPVTIGFWFSLGHSAVVFGLSAAIALTSIAIKDRFSSFENVGKILGTSVSALFLIAVAAANIMILNTVYRTFQKVKAGGAYDDEDLDLVFAKGGRLGRAFRGLFRLVGHGWQMFPVGFLFGLGFDTATEVALLGISAAEATQGLPVWDIMVFPALFTAGMVLVDSADSMLMLGAYGWAFVKPIRKLYYNMTITLVSVLVALLIGGIEVLGLVGDQFKLRGLLWTAVGALNSHFGAMGAATIAVFVATWMVAALIYRWKRYDRIEAGSGPLA